MHICEQRSILGAKDRTLMSCNNNDIYILIANLMACINSGLIGEFESFAHHDLILNESDEPAVVRHFIYYHILSQFIARLCGFSYGHSSSAD